MKQNLLKTIKHMLEFNESRLRSMQLPSQEKIFSNNIIMVLNLQNRLKTLMNNKIARDDHFEQCYPQMRNLINNQLLVNENFINNIQDHLNALDPRKVLKRGYAIIKSERGIIKTVNEVTINDKVTMEMHDGMVETVVKEVKKYG
jgi:exodeoxyribonuclease VII large subunit